MVNINDVKVREAFDKLVDLSHALEACGIDSAVVADHETDAIILTASLWNCVDGSEVEFSVISAEVDDWELFSYAEPRTQSEELMKRM